MTDAFRPICTTDEDGLHVTVTFPNKGDRIRVDVPMVASLVALSGCQFKMGASAAIKADGILVDAHVEGREGQPRTRPDVVEFEIRPDVGDVLKIRLCRIPEDLQYVSFCPRTME